MKHIIVIAAILFSTLSFSQKTGLIVGKVLDNEVENAPLVLADISIKDTEVKASTDQTGMFVIENLKAGDYTLVCSFVGYEPQEVDVHVDGFNPVELKLTLEASNVSMDDIALAMAMANAGQSSKNTSDQ
ncbi:carboxypeptidase-like regulatory domain-containing protein [Tamlana crocina]